jgi:hypothetical protein
MAPSNQALLLVAALGGGQASTGQKAELPSLAS